MRSTVLALFLALAFSSIQSKVLRGITSGPQVSVEFTNATAQFNAQPSLTFQSGSAPTGSTIQITESVQYQTMQGFGAALTDSSAWLISRLPADQYNEVMNKLFNATSGIGISFIRLPISTCDFALTNYTYDNQPIGQTDPALQSFSIRHDQAYIIPLIKDALKLNPTLQIITSPWTPPAWLKTNDIVVGTTNGTCSSLLPQFYETYANYFVKVSQDYLKEGININTMTIQNEPQYGPLTYPGMCMNQTEQANFINDHLAPAYIRNNITTKVFVFDHNWDSIYYPLEVSGNLTDQAKQVVGGTAFHCYYGNVTNQTVFHNQFPEQHIYMTECSGEDNIQGFTNILLWDMENILIGAVNNWAEVSLKWNIALNQDKGPQNGGCPDCRGLITIHTDTGDIEYNPDYYTVGTFSKNVPVNSKRIDATSNDDSLLVSAFELPDSSIVVIVLNNDSADHDFSLSWNNSYAQTTIPQETVAVYKWNPSSITV